MLKVLRRLGQNEKGATLVEYALIIAGVALIAAATISIFGHKTNDMLATTTAVLPGAHPEDNAPIVSGKIIETSPNAPGLDQGNTATGVGIDVNAITQGNNTGRLANDVGSDGNLTSLVLESTKK
jgi:pilus assembly protein Flp/PilA